MTTPPTTAANDPPTTTWPAPPANAVLFGWPGAVGLLPFMEMLLTSRDGQGVASETIGAERVMVLSGAAEGQDVPQGASTVDVCWGG